mgnify:CR=1 FL=1
MRRVPLRHGPLRRRLPEDVAGATVFLASDASSWISGIIIDIHGGVKYPGTPTIS